MTSCGKDFLENPEMAMEHIQGRWSRSIDVNSSASIELFFKENNYSLECVNCGISNKEAGTFAISDGFSDKKLRILFYQTSPSRRNYSLILETLTKGTLTTREEGYGDITFNRLK
jgi:hypothetical protein